MSKGRILLVEPDDDIREWIEAALEVDNYEVWAVDSAEKGLELVDVLQPHLLVLDNAYDNFSYIDDIYYPLLGTGVPYFLLGREQWDFSRIVLDGDTFSPCWGEILKQALDEADRLKLRKATKAYLNKW